MRLFGPPEFPAHVAALIGDLPQESVIEHAIYWRDPTQVSLMGWRLLR
jgi:hypothetical protein